jgi:hypothetical protein
MHAQRGSRLPVGSRLVAGGLAAGVMLLGLAGCDSGAVLLGSPSATVLHDKVAAVRAAADSHDRAAAVAAVDAFRAEVWRLADAGELSKADAAALLAHADAIAADVLDTVVALPTPTPSPSPSVTPEPTPEPAPTVSPANVEALRQQTADRLTELLRERLAEYVKQRMAEQQAEQQAAEKAAKKAKKDRHGKGGRDAH